MTVRSATPHLHDSTAPTDAVRRIVATVVTLAAIHADDDAVMSAVLDQSPTAQLREARDRVLEGLRLNPFLDLTGIRAARALDTAIAARDASERRPAAAA